MRCWSRPKLQRWHILVQGQCVAFLQSASIRRVNAPCDKARNCSPSPRLQILNQPLQICREHCLGELPACAGDTFQEFDKFGNTLRPSAGSIRHAGSSPRRSFITFGKRRVASSDAASVACRAVLPSRNTAPVHGDGLVRRKRSSQPVSSIR